MYLRESTMPPEDYWETLFDVPAILDRFQLEGDAAELGCGYGTFTLPLARRIRGTVHAIDIDPEMVKNVRDRATEERLTNIEASVRDVMTEGFGLPDSSCGGCLLFNILHGELPLHVLREAKRILKPNGSLAVIHWRSDIETPRGPSLAIRPSPEQIQLWVKEVGGFELRQAAFLLPPWHFGLEFRHGDSNDTAADADRAR